MVSPFVLVYNTGIHDIRLHSARVRRIVGQSEIPNQNWTALIYYLVLLKQSPLTVSRHSNWIFENG